MESIKRKFFVPITEERKRALAERVTTINIEIEGKIELKKALPKDIEGLQEAAAELSHEYQTGTSEVEIECYWCINDPEPLKKSLYRQDTGELIEVQDMDLLDNSEDLEIGVTPEELQLKMLPVGIEEAKIVDEPDEPTEVFEQLIKFYENDKKEITCHIDQLVETICLGSFVNNETAKMVADKLIAEYYDSDTIPGEFMLVTKHDYKPFKALLAKTLSEYQDTNKNEPETAPAIGYDETTEVSQGLNDAREGNTVTTDYLMEKYELNNEVEE